MKLFIDTANLQDIRNALDTGTVAGVTTNPSLLSKEPKEDFTTHISKIISVCKDYGDIPLSVEVFAEDPEGMYSQAIEIYEHHNYENLNIKIPVGYEELKVISRLASKGIPTNCTCCFTSSQLEMAALAGSRYVSLFYNRLLDSGGNPKLVLQQTRNFINKSNLNCEIISGSIRTPADVTTSWDHGSHIVTTGLPVIKKMMLHPQTDLSVQGFLSDFKEWIG
jgi:transaldolase